jgi:ATP-binding cassette subfamily B protein/subfamily B ATP-binding cassette protein MsbA
MAESSNKQPDSNSNEEFFAPSSRRRFAAFLATWRRVRKQKNRVSDDGRLAGKLAWYEEAQTSKDTGTRKRWLRRYYLWLRPWWPHLCGVTLLGLVVIGIDLSVPILTGLVLDVATVSEAARARLPVALRPLGGAQLIMLLSATAMLAVVASVLIGMLRSIVQRWLFQRIQVQLRCDVWAKIIRLQVSDLQEMKSGGAAARVGTDVETMTGLVLQMVLSPAQSVLRLLLVAGLMLSINWQVAMAAFVLLALIGFAVWLYTSGVRPVYRSMADDQQRVEARIAEALQGIRVVRSFARELREELVHAIGRNTGARKYSFAENQMARIIAIFEFLVPCVTVVIVGLGGWFVLHGRLTAGQVLSFQMLVFQALGPVQHMIFDITNTQRALAAMERVYEVLDRPNEKPDLPDAVSPPEGNQPLRFEKVSFVYGVETNRPEEGPAFRDNQQPVLRDIDFELASGTVTALVGPSGAGKSTLADLMGRYHDPSRGAIRLGGIDIRRFSLAEYRRLFGIVMQDVFLFDGTVADNLRYARRNATDAELEQAAGRANALEFIRQMPHGFDSIVGERGTKLSGGQRQRLSIARAILANPRFLILDEATSSLDTASEQLIQQALNQLLHSDHRTTLVIAHRLSTIRSADLILVLDQGQIVERGNHATLMAVGPGGMYHDMVRRQELTGETTIGWRPSSQS